MGKKCKTFYVITEIIQWVIIVMLGFLVYRLAPFTNRAVSDDTLEQLRKEETYRQIYNDQRLHRLKQENQALEDSIKAINEGEKCTGIHYIVVRDTIYMVDTIFFKQ